MTNRLARYRMSEDVLVVDARTRGGNQPCVDIGLETNLAGLVVSLDVEGATVVRDALTTWLEGL